MVRLAHSGFGTEQAALKASFCPALPPAPTFTASAVSLLAAGGKANIAMPREMGTCVVLGVRGPLSPGVAPIPLSLLS